MLRPWRVGVLVDTSDAVQVRSAIADLSSVWGGASMPIFDVNTPLTDLEELGRLFDVDSLYADVSEGALGEFLSRPGWAWRGRGQWGPFASAEGGTIRTGLLPTRAILDLSSSLVLPTWNVGEAADLLLAATWGISDGLDWPVLRTPYVDLIWQEGGSRGPIGALSAGMLHLTYRGGDSFGRGVFVVRADHPQDAVEYWNRRAFGDEVIGVPADGDLGFVRNALAARQSGTQERSASGRSSQVLEVSGLELASDEVADLIRGVADRDELAIRAVERGSRPYFVFPGLHSPFTRSLRTEMAPEAHWVDVDLPTLPMAADSNALEYWRGIVAAEVTISEVRGQDPRFTPRLPPYRRHAALIQTVPSVDQGRVGEDGLVLGTQAHAEELRIPFALNLEVMRLLFDEPAKVDQSDVGRFQTRASEKFGGPYTGTFTQPGVRAAVMLAARSRAGVTLPHLRQLVEHERGGWPDLLRQGTTSPREYAIRAVNGLFGSGLFVPTLRVHCSHCRVESYVSADQLATIMQCEFCGHSFDLALSHGLAPPDWHYRLAGHLRADQVEALMPALATTSVLGQLRMSQEPSPLVLGLKVELEGHKIEVDVASFFMDPQPIAVLGEVKTANRIDDHDVQNLEFFQERLRSRGVSCLLLFATLKEQFSPEEKGALRALVERSRWTKSRSGAVPNVPLLLTGPDLSRSPWDKEHPWRWNTNHGGLFDTAMASCERNLGLRGFAPSWGDDDQPDFAFDWVEGGASV